jgi:hypothetical protein
VTFELGRPMGVPDDAPLQRRVLRAALELLIRTDGPLIADYPEDVADEVDFSGYACPVNLAPRQVDDLAAEVDRLATWYYRSVSTYGRATVGLSGLTMPEAGRLVTHAVEGVPPAAQPLKLAIDDLKAYYLEAASAFPSPGSSKERTAWFWGETRLGCSIDRPAAQARGNGRSRLRLSRFAAHSIYRKPPACRTIDRSGRSGSRGRSPLELQLRPPSSS